MPMVKAMYKILSHEIGHRYTWQFSRFFYLLGCLLGATTKRFDLIFLNLPIVSTNNF